MFITDVKSAVAYYSVDETETETEMKALVVITKQRGKGFSVGQIGPSFYFPARVVRWLRQQTWRSLKAFSFLCVKTGHYWLNRASEKVKNKK